jgi:hypothetical protein
MRRPFAALLLGAMAAGLLVIEAGPLGVPVRNFFASWLGANALPKAPVVVSAIDIPTDKIAALDAALILRAVERYEPRAVAFFVPLRFDGKESLLASKLAESKFPVLFTSNDEPESLPAVVVASSVPQLSRLPAYVPPPYVAGGFALAPMGHVLIVGRQGAHAVASNVFCLAAQQSKVSGKVPGVVRFDSASVPVDDHGFTKINPLARHYAEHISLGQLMLQTERSEGGSISTILDSKFRGRLVAVQLTGSVSAEGTAAILNNLTGQSAPFAVSVVCVLLAAWLPWWSANRRMRALLAFMACCGWTLLALAAYQEFQMVVPLLPAVLLPALGLIPPSSNKSQ